MPPELPRRRKPPSRPGVSAAIALGLAFCGCDRGPPPRAAAQVHAAPAPSPAGAAAAATPVAPPLMTSADVDARLRADWLAAGVAPTPPADDATWLRRLWVDVAGTIPPPEVVRRFLADPVGNPGVKRARAIDELLASPRWAAHWTAYWDDVWMGRDARRQDVDAGAFRGWLHEALSRNEPWNELVSELLTATGRNSAGGPKRDAEANDGQGGPAEGVNGAVNWTLRYQEAPQDMAGAASRTLLGVQIQCAQCHDHKTEKWTQKDFEGFAAAFVRTRLEPADGPPADAGKGTVRRVDLSDLARPAPRFAKKMADVDAITRARPAAIDGTDLGDGKDVRAALARWVTSPDNPWFARAFVNRMWGHFLGRGFVDPVDDMRPSNPAVAPDLLGALATDFVASGYDMKHLVRVIAGTAAYAASAAPLEAATSKADPEAKLWERFRVTPLGPEELLDAVVAATKLDAVVESTGRLEMAQVRARVKQRYGFLFDVDEESDQSDYVGTIAQGLALLNGSVVATGASVLPGSALAEVLAMPADDAPKIEELYVRTLSRLPTPGEVERWTRFVQTANDAPDPAPGSKGADRPGAPDPLRGLETRAGRQRADARARAYEDLLWTLLNSSEFVLNH
jgi:Protein of unknown function (DUF1549)/Protein of unknown function (DUF1553)